jgi:enediyne biosynthesis protein E4
MNKRGYWQGLCSLRNSEDHYFWLQGDGIPSGTDISKKIDYMKKILSLFLVIFLSLIACRDQLPSALFAELPSEHTGITFSNQVTQSGDNHVLNYGYFFNGGGVATGDINNDGLVDIYFSGNQVSNKLYLNKGDFEFEDITDKAGVGASEGWKTGVTMTDINLDGWMDIYVCRSAMSDSLLRENLLFINNQDRTFTERAKEFGLNDNSYSTHAAFFDFDNDHDLDLFVLNHSLPRYAGFSKLLASMKNQDGGKFGSKLYQNQNGKYVNVSKQAGLISNVLSFGLGVGISDLNNDGFMDMYISNDFNEEDYLYMNNGDGTFTNTIKTATDHVSLFSMGSDIADINNDGLTDIYTLDMLPASNERIKLSSGDDNYDKYQVLVNSGFHHQTTRNMLQLNNGDGTFSEIGQLAGISNTDWSWAAVFQDFDGDGWKDLFVTNGYEKDYTNMQFLKFTVDEKLKSQQTGASMDVQRILNSMPSINEGNFLFQNNGDLSFSNKTKEWGITTKNKSSGTAYADFDNDGDQDLVVNVMNGGALVYRNSSAEKKQTGYVRIELLKNNKGINVIGTKVKAYSSGTQATDTFQISAFQYFEFIPVRGYQSSMMSPISIGLGNTSQLDSVSITWPDGKKSSFKNVLAGSVISPAYADAKSSTPKGSAKNISTPLLDSSNLINWTHQPADVNDFKRQILLPHMYSYSGPKMATGDVNSDGLEDIFVGGAKGQSSLLFFQQRNGEFKIQGSNPFAADKEYQDENATFFDADGDKDLDLYVVGGGYLFNTNDPMLQDRLYRNDGRGNFMKDGRAIPAETEAGSVVVPFDLDGDKDLDLFVGGRITPGQYPVNPKSLLLINDGNGNFVNRSEEFAPGLQYTGMVCDARATDIDKDGRSDLILAGEWMPIEAWMNRNGKLVNETSKWFPFANNGWWNCLDVNDFDNDGDLDVMAGNAGTNNQFNVSTIFPATLIFKDFNNDNQVDPFFCYFINGKSYPYASRDEALGQVNFLKPRFPDYTSYANVSIENIFTPEELKDTVLLKANELRTCLFENKGGYFENKVLPTQAQWSPVYSIASVDVNGDGLKDLVIGGNESYVRVRLGRNSSSRGMLFVNKGKNEFEFVPNKKSGLDLKGDVREVKVVMSESQTTLLVGAVGQPVQSYIIRAKP